VRGDHADRIADQERFGNHRNAYRLVQQFLAKASDVGIIAYQRKVENLWLDVVWRHAWCLRCPVGAAR
jgi:hypothetical protein